MVDGGLDILVTCFFAQIFSYPMSWQYQRRELQLLSEFEDKVQIEKHT